MKAIITLQNRKGTTLVTANCRGRSTQDIERKADDLRTSLKAFAYKVDFNKSGGGYPALVRRHYFRSVYLRG